MIDIWEPRYHDNTVLVGTRWVTRGRNLIRFTRAKHLAGKVYEIDEAQLIKYPTQKNGKGRVYVVPFDDLRICE